jgi:hypothetical protein
MTTALHPCHEAARHYLALGLHPIPCVPGTKKPYVDWKIYQTEPPLADELDEWWHRWPEANVGLVLGRETFAVDLDGGEAGGFAAEALLAQYGVQLPPEAPRSQTFSGFHVLLSSPVPVRDHTGLLSTNGEKPKVDIKGVGLIIAPPSIHETGRVHYQWMQPPRLPFPVAPPALLDLLAHPPHQPTRAATHQTLAAPPHSWGGHWVAEALQGVPEGQRDDTCTRLAGYFLHHGLDESVVEGILADGWAPRCTPPFPRAEVLKCIRSIARREVAKDPGTGNGSGNGTGHPADPQIRAYDDELTAALEALRHPPPAQIVRSGFSSLDYYLGGGFRPGELVYVGARPGVGKTAFGLEIAHGAAAAGTPVLIVSREMTTHAIVCRMLAQQARVPASVLKEATLTEHDWGLIDAVLPRLKTLPIWLTDHVHTIGEILQLVRASQPRFQLVILDYLQLIHAPREIRERRLQVEHISQALKAVALEVPVAILCLSSLARPTGTVKERQGWRPGLESLRESGELEHDADVVLFLHREFAASPTECRIAKNRDGRVGTVHLEFLATYVAFKERDHAANPQPEA